jgi:hypothetical protein
MSIVLFTIATSAACTMLVTEDGTFELLNLSPSDALSLWRSGTPHVHITPMGARELLADTSADELRALLPVCKTSREVKAIAYLQPGDDALQAAATARIRRIRNFKVRLMM